MLPSTRSILISASNALPSSSHQRFQRVSNCLSPLGIALLGLANLGDESDIRLDQYYFKVVSSMEKQWTSHNYTSHRHLPGDQESLASQYTNSLLSTDIFVTPANTPRATDRLVRSSTSTSGDLFGLVHCLPLWILQVVHEPVVLLNS